MVEPLSDPTEIQVSADEVSAAAVGRSTLKGHVVVRDHLRQVTAKTATIYRDKKTQAVTSIVLNKDVHYLESGRLMVAKRVTLHPTHHAGVLEQVVYRFETTHAHARLPAWGQAAVVERFSNENLLLKDVTYSTCSPLHRAWQIEAREIQLDHATHSGVARDARLRVLDWPLLRVPYLSFPTSRARQSGFLMPITGYSNVGGFDMVTPYYWNIAPNYDATLMPHLYTLRGVMLGGDMRFLTAHSSGVVGGNFLPHDAAFNQFLLTHQDQFPVLKGMSSNRWSVLLHDNTAFLPQLNMNINFQQVSDNYYLQDFSSNLSILTENQILRQGDLTYTTDHWRLRGLLQSYQTLHPVDQSAVATIYERLPQLLAEGHYTDLPFHTQLDLLGQMDYFRWPDRLQPMPEGPRYHFNPILSLPITRPYGYVTPSVQWVENHYQLSEPFVPSQSQSFNRSIPRYMVDSGLLFEREVMSLGHAYLNTLEPRLYYLNVPYQNQSQFPAFDSAYMIFSTDQLFRNNRFSGFDRIGDANQLAYALTSRWLSHETGAEKASVTVGQLRYFSKRRVQLCTDPSGQCSDSALFLGYTSPIATYSPIASRAVYALNTAWRLSGDYVFDVFTHATNNGNLDLHYQPAPDRLVTLGYHYLVDGNLIAMPTQPLQNTALHQATLSYAWPMTEQWSSLGVYSYNVSQGYGMMTFLGLQYDSCCFAVRLLGGRTFKSLTPDGLTPRYNHSAYVQVLLKGLGSVANSDPASILQSYLPGYLNIF